MSNYKRDNRSPVPKDDKISRIMSANKAKETQPELILRKALYANGVRGYRLNYRKVPGRPDIALISKKIAIFVHGCFWHRCPKCKLTLPKYNTEFWCSKFNKNEERDKRKEKELVELGWRVITIWECELKSDLENKLKELKTILKRIR